MEISSCFGIVSKSLLILELLHLNILPYLYDPADIDYLSVTALSCQFLGTLQM